MFYENVRILKEEGGLVKTAASPGLEIERETNLAAPAWQNSGYPPELRTVHGACRDQIFKTGLVRRERHR